MAALPQQVAIGFANSLLSLASQAQTLRAQLEDLGIQYANVQPNLIWAQMATFTVSPDGSAGAADATPVATNPISVGGINRSAVQLGYLVTLISDYQAFLAGNLTGQSFSRNQLIDQIVG